MILYAFGFPRNQSTTNESHTTSLLQLGKKLKKNNVALDIISFGTSSDSSSTPLDLSIPSLSAPTASTSTSTTEPSTTPETNESKLEALIGAVSSSENSHFLSVDPGPHLLSEKIMQSPIVRGDSSGSDDEGGAGGSGGGGGGDADEFGVDPNLDPELAMVRTSNGLSVFQFDHD